MKNIKENLPATLLGGSFVVLGLLLLASLLEWVNSASLYATLLPIGLILAGIMLISPPENKKRSRGIAFGILGLGIVSLLVRFDVISGDAINATLGVILLVAGTVTITRIVATKKDVSADK